jgi:Gram-negative pili assembly chaperone, N-terminal domain.
MRLNKSKIIVLIVAVMLVAGNLFAFQFSPLTQVFEVKGPSATKTYTITNDSDDPIAVEMTALRRDQDANGNEVNTDASAYFSIQPARSIIQPQSSLIVRVQYRGPQTVTSELSFRIKAEQIQYSQGKSTQSQSMFNFLYVYISSAYIAPSKVTERVVVSSIAPTQDGNMAIKLTNAGTVHQVLDGLVINIMDGEGNAVSLSGSDMLPELNGMNILARKAVTKTVPWPEGLSKNSSYKASLSYDFSYSNM